MKHVWWMNSGYYLWKCCEFNDCFKIRKIKWKVVNNFKFFLQIKNISFFVEYLLYFLKGQKFLIECDVQKWLFYCAGELLFFFFKFWSEKLKFFMFFQIICTLKSNLYQSLLLVNKFTNSKRCKTNGLLIIKMFSIFLWFLFTM